MKAYVQARGDPIPPPDGNSGPIGSSQTWLVWMLSPDRNCISILVSAVYFQLTIWNKCPSRRLHVMNGSGHLTALKRSRMQQQFERKAHKSFGFNVKEVEIISWFNLCFGTITGVKPVVKLGWINKTEVLCLGGKGANGVKNLDHCVYFSQCVKVSDQDSVSVKWLSVRSGPKKPRRDIQSSNNS